MKTFILIKRNFYNGSKEWWSINPFCVEELSLPADQRGEIMLSNEYGGHNYLLSTDEVLEIVSLKDWDELWAAGNVKKTTEYQELVKNSTDESLGSGWLAPDGKMHYCAYHDHINYVHIVLDSDVPTLQGQGWLHIIKVDSGLYYNSDKRITQDQARVLREMGLHVFEENVIYQ